MKTSLKTTVSIIAIAVCSISLAQADQNKQGRDFKRGYEQSSQQQRNILGGNKQRLSSKRDGYYAKHNQHNLSREKQSHKNKYRVNKHQHKRYIITRKHSHKYDKKINHGYKRVVIRQNTYVAPRHPSYTVFVEKRHKSHNGLPVLAGTLIGSSIANDISDGDPVATFGGAVFGAIIGNAISHQ